MKRVFQFFSIALLVLCGQTAHAQFLQALASFGGGDGWLAPSEFAVTPGADLMRGMTYHAPSNRLIVVDRTGGINVRLLDGNTGASVGALVSNNVSGGQFAANMVSVADDGHVYMGNLSVSTTQNFKIYRWDSSEVSNPTSAPTIAFDGASGRTRTGDSFAVTGSGANTRIVSAGGSNAGQHFAHFTTGDGLSYSPTNPSVTGLVGAGHFRLGLDFDDAGNVIGSQTGAGTTFYRAPELGGAAATSAKQNISEAPLAFYAPMSLLATVQVAGAPSPPATNPGDVGLINTVRLYDASDLNNLVLLDSKNLTNIATTNGNGVGSVSFGLGPDGGLRLYVLNTNNGIQAFRVVPEPSSGLLALASGVGLIIRRRHRA